jgi:hypothetical protein
VSIYLRAAKALQANAHSIGHQGMCTAIGQVGEGYSSTRYAQDLLESYFKPLKAKNAYWAGRYNTFDQYAKSHELVERNLNRRIICLLLMHEINKTL